MEQWRVLASRRGLGRDELRDDASFAGAFRDIEFRTPDGIPRGLRRRVRLRKDALRVDTCGGVLTELPQDVRASLREA